jgi:hypothetical protein
VSNRKEKLEMGIDREEFEFRCEIRKTHFFVSNRKFSPENIFFYKDPKIRLLK